MRKEKKGLEYESLFVSSKFQISNLCFKPIYDPFLRSLISYETNGIREICNNWEVDREKGLEYKTLEYKSLFDTKETPRQTVIEISNPCFEPWLPILNRFLRSLILISYETNEIEEICNNEKWRGKKGLESSTNRLSKFQISNPVSNRDYIRIGSFDR